MDPKALAIPFAFILLAAILCWLLISAKGKWWLKLLVIVVVPAFGIVVWNSTASYLGWPTSERLPEKGLLLWAVVHEPLPGGSDPGIIYVWIVPMTADARDNPLDYAADRGEPRAYKLPYSRGAHEKLERARQMLKQGRPVMIEGEAGEGSGEGDGEPSGEEGANGRSNGQPGGGHGDRRQDFGIYELPPPVMQPKE